MSGHEDDRTADDVLLAELLPSEGAKRPSAAQKVVEQKLGYHQDGPYVSKRF